MLGIDISNHNGNIDFNKVRQAGVEVVIIKATEGVDYIDSYLEKNYSGAAGKFNIGFYHFMSERTSPSEQAYDFYNAIKDKQYNVLPCLDIETNSFNRNAKEVTDRCLEFINRFKDLSGQSVMIYTGGYFGRDNLDSRIKSYPGWIAHYGVQKPMDTGFNVVGHQYTEKGSVNGISGNVDMNNFTEAILISKASVKKIVATQKGDNWVPRLQQECNVQGFSKQTVDGIPGPITLAGCPTIKIGARGKITELLQEKLNSLGFNCGSVDGIFGENTRQAVMKYQSSRGLLPDGVVGQYTWRKLLGI